MLILYKTFFTLIPNHLYGRKRKETHIGFYLCFEREKVGEEIVVSYMCCSWTDGRGPSVWWTCLSTKNWLNTLQPLSPSSDPFSTHSLPHTMYLAIPTRHAYLVVDLCHSKSHPSAPLSLPRMFLFDRYLTIFSFSYLLVRLFSVFFFILMVSRCVQEVWPLPLIAYVGR